MTSRRTPSMESIERSSEQKVDEVGLLPVDFNGDTVAYNAVDDCCTLWSVTPALSMQAITGCLLVSNFFSYISLHVDVSYMTLLQMIRRKSNK
eukprot:5979517-Amphidinium_carterae.1